MLRLALLLLLLALPCQAQLIGVDPTPNLPGKLTLSLTYIGSNGQLSFDRRGQPAIRSSSEVDIHSLRLILGLADNLDMTVTTGEGFLAREDGNRLNSPMFGHGADDTQLRFRYRFVNEENALQIALVSVTTVPTGGVSKEDRLGLGRGFTAQTLGITARQDFDRFQLWTEGSFSFPFVAGPQTNTVWSSNLALGYLIGDTVEPTLEFSYVSANPGSIQELSYTLACTIFANEDIIICGGLQQVFAGTNTDLVRRPILRFIYNF